MRSNLRIKLFSAICAIILVASCTKEHGLQQNENTYDFVKVQMSFTTKAGASSAQGDQINNVMVWAYRITGTQNGVAVVEDTPCGWGTAT